MQKKRALGALLCLLCALFLSPVFAGEEAAYADTYGMVHGGWLNIRELPSLESQVSGTVENGTRVHILGQQDGWYYAETPDGKAGYMSAGYITPGSSGIIENGGDFVNLRNKPNYDAAVLGTFDSGTLVEMYDTEDEWTRVYVDGKTGYMVSSFLQPAPDIVQPESLAPTLTEQAINDVTAAGTEGIAAAATPDIGIQTASPNATGAPAALILPEMTVPGVTPQLTAAPILEPTPLPAHLITIMPVEATATPQAPQTLQESVVAESTVETPEVLPIADTQGPADNPYLLLMDSGEDLVQQYGTGESYVDYREGFYCTVVYPVSGLDAVDTAMRSWARDLVQQAEQLVLDAETTVETELNVQYDAYFVGGRYVGILETGWYNNSLLSQPADVVHTQNIDVMDGTLITYRDIFTAEQIPAVLALLSQRYESLSVNPLTSLGVVPQESWLEEVVIHPDGVAVVLPKGRYLPESWGTQRILLSYDELSGAGLLAMEKPVPTQVAQQGSAQPLPVGPGQRTIDPSRPMVALTFDDGPSETTPKILSLLDQYGGRATFFVVGNRLANYNDILVQIAEQGSEIGCHTWSHKKLTELKDSDIEWQITKTTTSIMERTGQQVVLMRPPYGSHNANVRAVSRKLGLSVIFWSLDTEDWRTRSASATYDVIMKNVKSGSIILCHDLHEATGEAMELVIPALVEQGYQLVTVSELLFFLPDGMQPGRVYSQLSVDEL